MGRAWVFGDSVNTDDIIPGIYSISVDAKEAASHAFVYKRPEFAKEVRKGDLVIAGENFGFGSSREAAVLALKGSGVHAVIAKSYAHILYRNAINNGLLVLKPEEELVVKDGDEVELDVKRMVLVNKSTGKEFKIKRLRPFLMKVVNEGGLVSYINRYGGYA